MAATDLIMAALFGSVCLAIGATLWALYVSRRAGGQVAEYRSRLDRLEGLADATQASAEAFDSAMITIEGGVAKLAWGGDTLSLCAEVLGLPEAELMVSPAQVIDALLAADPGQRRRLGALIEAGEACAFQVRGPKGMVSVDGRSAGACAWLKLQPILAAEGGLPPAARFAVLLDALPEPAWVCSAGGALVWANQAWLDATEAASLEDAITRKLVFDRAAVGLVSEAAAAGEPRQILRWAPVKGQRRAFRITAQPLEGGDIGVWAQDVTEAEDTREALKRHVEAHDETLNHLGDAVAIFSAAKRLLFHNTAFAQLWGLEPAWLAEGPSHAEVLDRLRQRRRLPETADYSRWKTGELAWYETLGPAPDDLWTLPDGRTLRVVRQPHPLGGLLLLFSDITGELRLKAQYNGLIQVQQATLDKLSDAVAVFGSDGRLRLHNEAFAKFWNVTSAQIETAADFDGVVELSMPRLHDQQFWRELKGRVTDPDPRARFAISGEAKTSDDRIVSYQSRPLPDGATLVAFADITDTRRLERAVADRSAALAEAERLKRDFVGNVSYELRTPLTTILGYSELLDRAGDALPERARGHVAAVRSAANQLAGSIDDVLDIAQIDAGEMALELGDVRIPELLAEAEARWARQAADVGVSITVACEKDIGLIRADNRRLGQILDHLVENAIDQTPPGGKVALSARRAHGEVQIQVSDTGRGIPFHVQAHIFDRFVGRERGGPGLGLALVKALIELHGGWVALESEPGAGATFTCHLPETAYEAAAGQAELF
ncbi:PAS domain-containing sensor histidine kinase [Phenylobacterium montanum]|uniref:histidine kinase n=1 Tax=Phenylobacterium montanum TaxID=2823693 RepID=A0A975ITQ7_9CAUL|nr:ATP-binding protein [Caulobacter sp. S6]QUD87018.1 PAS-domain containing protein [Caulobacter sp. S6]